MEIALAQLNPVAGDLERNARAIVRAVAQAGRAGAGLVITPALALTGPVSPDRKFEPAFTAAVDRILEQLAGELRGPPLVLDRSPCTQPRIVVLPDGIVGNSHLYASGNANVLDIGGLRVALAVADDALCDTASSARMAGAQVLVAAAASPFRLGAHDRRRALCSAAAMQAGVPIYVVNAVGVASDGVLDGASFVTDASGELAQQLPAWHATTGIARICSGAPVPVRGRLDSEAASHVYQALVLAVSAAALRCKAKRAIVVSDDRLDEALALAIARDALRGGDVKVSAQRVVHTQDSAADAAREVAPTLRIVARNRSRALLDATRAPPDDPTVLDLFADLSRTLQRTLAHYRRVLGGASTIPELDDVARTAQANAAAAVSEQDCDRAIAAVLEEGASRDDLRAQGLGDRVIKAVLPRLSARQIPEPAVRITSRPGDALFARSSA